jgi:hypothetical protein
MAEFKFSCPRCGQHIQCDPGYSGAQINCPSCQQTIVVPQAPHSAAAPAAPLVPPVPPPAAPGLSTKQSTTAPASGRRFAGAPGLTSAPPPKPKSKALKTVLIVTAAVVVLAGLGVGGWFGFTKIKEHKAAKANPAAQVPTPSATAANGALDILAKVHDAYTNLTSLNMDGSALMVIDMSALTATDFNPNANKNTKTRPMNIPKAITNATAVAIKLGRPDLYYVEAAAKAEVGRMTMTNTIVIWSPGKTNFVLFGKTYRSVKDRESALGFTTSAAPLSSAIAELFFDKADQMNTLITDWGQTSDETLNGQDFYTLTGKMLGQKLKIWVNKTSYMISQLQITLGAPMSDADIEKEMNAFNNHSNKTQQQIDQEIAVAKQQAAMMTKIRGTVTETYDTVEMNHTFSADDFNYPVPRGVRLTP